MTKKLTMRLIPALMLFGFAGVANAAGLAVSAQTGSGLGNAFAGAAAAAEDAGTIYANPAGMTYLPQGHSISLGASLLNRSVDFKNRGSVAHPVAAFGGAVIAPFGVNNADGGDAGGLAILPFGYWAYSIAPDVWVGVGVSPTFGNKTEYDRNFIGRGAGYMSEVKQININPSLAIKVNDVLSLGLGFDLAHASLHAKAGIPTSTTNRQDFKTDSWGVGANIGAMFQLSPSTRVGLAYRSGMSFDMEGKQQLYSAVAGSATLKNSKVTIDGYDTPGSLSLAVSQKLSDKWELLGDLTWTDWSVWNNLTLKQASSGTNIAVSTYAFEDSLRVGLGANYKYSDALKLRFGVAFDEGAATKAANRQMTLPDADRTWLSFGGKYTLSKVSSIDFGYAHVFVKDSNTARQVTSSGLLLQTINGKFEQSADYLSAQYNHTF
jgi:long-chain fatty acid transport protein